MALNRIGDGEAEDPRRLVQSLGMFRKLEDLAAISPLALEDSARIVETMRPARGSWRPPI